MQTADKWSHYFRSKMSKADWESLCKFRVQGKNSTITFPGHFLDERPTFEHSPDYHQSCEEPALAIVVKTEFDRQLAASNSAASNVMQAVIPTSTQAAPPAAVSPQAIVAGQVPPRP